MSDLVQLEMTLDEARETDRLIKRHINTTRYLLLDMRDRKGWKALGYESFKEYGEKSLGYEKAYLTRLADAGEISLQLGYDPELPIGNHPPESQLRPLKSVPESVRKEIWDEATRKAEEAGKKVTAKAVSEAVEEWKQRSEDWRQQSNGQRKKIRDLESQIDLLQARACEAVGFAGAAGGRHGCLVVARCDFGSGGRVVIAVHHKKFKIIPIIMNQ